MSLKNCQILVKPIISLKSQSKDTCLVWKRIQSLRKPNAYASNIKGKTYLLSWKSLKNPRKNNSFRKILLNPWKSIHLHRNPCIIRRGRFVYYKHCRTQGTQIYCGIHCQILGKRKLLLKIMAKHHKNLSLPWQIVTEP